MPTFERIQGAVHCDGLSLAELAARFGTPLYAYDAGAIAARYREVEDAFRDYPHRVHYALKANSTLGIARLLRSLGAAADANSVGEIDVALRAGFTPVEIVFTGVGKTDAELERAISLGLRSINAESEGEIERIDAIATARGVLRRRRHALSFIADAEPATDVEVLDGDARVVELGGEGHQRFRSALERLELGDLRADVAVQPDDLHAAPAAHAQAHLAGVGDGNAELVALQAGRDVRVAPGVDIRVDAQGDARADPLPDRLGVDRKSVV